MSPNASELVEVHLRGIPVGIWAQLDEDTKDLRREFALILLGARPGERDVPERLLQLIDRLQANYGHLNPEQEMALEDAVKRGDTEIEQLDYQIPIGVEADLVALGSMLDEADEYCRSGEYLLSLAASPVSKAFRDWFLSEFARQVRGEEPISWVDSSYARDLEAADAADRSTDS
ncbi:MAG: hypothetical protein ACRDZT_01480 [Acidimicrobiales bacterium]